MGEPLFHLAEARHWEEACASGRYEQSTRGHTLAEVGFVHLATRRQWRGVLERYYADHEGTLVLLTVDPERLDAPLRWEAPHEGTDELFPHLYGPLDVGAVVAAEPVTR